MKEMLRTVSFGLLFVGAGCSQIERTPTAPSATTITPSTIPPAIAAVLPQSLAGSHGHRLAAVVGEGDGIINISPRHSEPGFGAEIQVVVRGTRPNTTFNVKRTFDPNQDGICTGLIFFQFPFPNPGPLVTLTTSEGGAGSTHIKFERADVLDAFDWLFEVSTPDASIVLRTGCITVSVK